MEQYYQARLDHKREYNRLYYLQNKAKLNERFWCQICNGTFTTPNKASHFSTKKHIRGEGEAENRDSLTHNDKYCGVYFGMM